MIPRELTLEIVKLVTLVDQYFKDKKGRPGGDVLDNAKWAFTGLYIAEKGDVVKVSGGGISRQTETLALNSQRRDRYMQAARNLSHALVLLEAIPGLMKEAVTDNRAPLPTSMGITQSVADRALDEGSEKVKSRTAIQQARFYQRRREAQGGGFGES